MNPRIRAAELGVTFCPHSKSWLMRIVWGLDGWSRSKWHWFLWPITASLILSFPMFFAIAPYWAAMLLFGVTRFRGRAHEFWLTLDGTVYHPDSVSSVFLRPHILEHEFLHVVQQAKVWLWWWVFRYVTSWRHRWEMEGPAYLTNIRHGLKVSDAVEILQVHYGIKLSTEEMTEWFVSNLTFKHKGVSL